MITDETRRVLEELAETLAVPANIQAEYRALDERHLSVRLTPPVLLSEQLTGRQLSTHSQILERVYVQGRTWHRLERPSFHIEFQLWLVRFGASTDTSFLPRTTFVVRVLEKIIEPIE